MKEKVSFRIIQWNVEEVKEKETIIHISGLTHEKKQVYCKIYNYLPHCYLELPLDFKWNKTNCEILFQYIQKKLKECPPDSYKVVVKKTTLYALKRRYMCIRFFTKASYGHLANLCKYEWKIDDLYNFPKYSFKLHEQNINIEIKFCVENNIDPSGWVDVKGKLKDFSTCDYSIIADAKNVVRSSKYTNDDQISPKICVFDIELHSINRKSASPTPSIPGNVITMISLIFGRLGEEFDVHTVSLYDCKPKLGVLYDCKGNEKKLLKQFVKILKLHKPDIITGYNINGFDWGAILTRMEIHGLISSTKAWYEMPMTMGKLDEGDVIKDLSWGSSARGKQEKKFINLQGILNFDLYTEISFNYKLSSYALGYVSKHFLKDDTKDDMPFQQMFILYDMISVILKPVIQEIDLDVDLCKKLIKNCVSPQELYRTPDGDGGTTVNYPADMIIEVKKAKTVEKIIDICKNYWKKMVDYCIQDTLIIPKLMIKLNSLINLWENSNICKVPASFIFDRGQQIKVTAGIVSKFKINDHVFDYSKKEVVDDSEDSDDDKKKYQGASVLEMKHGLHRRVVILDFTSLYPSIMKQFNMCYTTYRLNDDERVKDEECYIAEWEEHRGCEHDIVGSKNKNVLCGKHRHRFLKPVEGKPDTIGTLPLFIDELLNYRVRVKNEMKEPERKYKELLIKPVRTEEEEKEMNNNKFKASVLDSRQNAIKVMCNSIYGYTGISKKIGTQPCEAIAASVTHYSRTFIRMAKELLLKRWNNLEVVYGDSVTGDTPILLQRNGKVEIHTIETMCNVWKPYEGFKIGVKGLSEKQQGATDFKVWTDQGWSEIKRVIRHKTHKKIYRVNSTYGSVDVTEDHSLLDINLVQIKPTELTSDTELLHSFFDFDVDFYGVGKKVQNFKNFLQRSRNFFFTGKKIPTTVNFLGHTDDFVYDLETSVGRFHAGVGCLIVKNTDSLFLKWSDVTLEECFALGKEASNYLALHLPEFIQMKFENVYDPALLITAKKYDYNIVDEKGNILKEDSKGSITSRRDNCDVAREIYVSVNKCIKNVLPFQETIDIMNEKILDMFRLKYALKKYVIYMCLTKDIDEYKNIAGHVRFAERLKEMGNDVKANTRLEFVFVKNSDVSAKTGDRMEDWKTFLMSENLRIDYTYYIEHKLVNVLTKILNLAYPVAEKSYMKHDEEFSRSMDCFLKPKWFIELKGLPLQKKALYIIRNSNKKRLKESAKRFYSEWLLEKIFKQHKLPYRYHYRKRPGNKKTVVYQNDRIVGNICKYHQWWAQVLVEIVTKNVFKN